MRYTVIQYWKASLCFMASVSLIGVGNHLRPVPDNVREELQVMVPVPLQILSAFGDRYLAANIGTWRSTMVGARQLSADELTALTQIQLSSAWLNPGHEDNYYSATAILPWAGKVQETQWILAQATDARQHDLYPPFFYGFNAMHFLGDFATASQYAQIAATHTESDAERQALTVIASRWSEKTDDPKMAVRIVRKMAEDTRDPALRDYLLRRANRLEGLANLRKAAEDYKAMYDQPLTDLQQLVKAGMIAQLPVDPMGGGYALKNEWPVLLPPKDP